VLARLRPHLPAILGALLGVAVLAWLGLVDFAWSDYDNEAAPAFRALGEGRIADFLALAPAYGGSLVLRAPFAAIPTLWGGGELAIYRAGSLMCMLVAAGFGVWLVAELRGHGRSTLVRASALGLCAAGPIAERAVEIGHPEELLGGVLCVAALLAAGRRRVLLAAVLLGLAVATKLWTLVAVAPVLLLMGRQAWRGALVAGVVTCAVMAPVIVAHPSAFAGKTKVLADTGSIFQPWQAFWFAGDTDQPVRGGDGKIKIGYRAAPAWIERVTHPLIILLSPLLTGLLWLSRRRRGGVGLHDALLLLAFLLHLRCLLDTWNFVYYAWPFLLALLTWETLARDRPPFLALLATVALWVCFQEMVVRGFTADQLSVAYLIWAVPAAIGLGVRLYAPGLWRTVVSWASSPIGVRPNVGPA
jgi:hypothetical protein